MRNSNIQTIKDTKTKAIKSRRVAIELRRKGFDILNTTPDKSNPKFDVYIFNDTPEFQTALKEIL